jgi:hypothetical protein
MLKSIIVSAEISLPLNQLVEAVGPEVSRALVAGYVPPAKRRPPNQTLQVAVDRVVDAFDNLEKVTNTLGERNAREHLFMMLRTLRATSSKIRSK